MILELYAYHHWVRLVHYRYRMVEQVLKCRKGEESWRKDLTRSKGLPDVERIPRRRGVGETPGAVGVRLARRESAILPTKQAEQMLVQALYTENVEYGSTKLGTVFCILSMLTVSWVLLPTINFLGVHWAILHRNRTRRLESYRRGFFELKKSL